MYNAAMMCSTATLTKNAAPLIDKRPERAPPAAHPSLRDALAVMLEEQLETDVSFRLSSEGWKEVVHVHKFILIARSPVFRAMFCGPMKTRETEIEIPDVDPDCFKIMIRYLYTDEVSINEDTVLALLYVGCKYLVQGLINECVQFLTDNLDEDNVCMVLELSKLFLCTRLKDNCMDFLIRRTAMVLRATDFLDLTYESVLELLQSDVLNATEEQLVRGALTWAEAQCEKKSIEISARNMRLMLGDAFFKLRLPCLPKDVLEDFLDVSSDILTIEEKQELEKCLDCGHGTVSSFPSTKRLRSESSRTYCEILTKSSRGLTFANKVHRLECVTHEDLTIHTVEVLDSAPTSHAIQVTVSIIQDEVTLCQFSTKVHAGKRINHLGAIVSVNFPNPPKVLAGTFHIGVAYRFVGGLYGTVPRGMPQAEEIDCDGIVLKFPGRQPSFLAGIMFSLES